MSKKTYIAYQPVEIKNKQQNTSNTYWNRIGTGWVNQDGSINVQLHSTPIDGKFQLREPREDDKE